MITQTPSLKTLPTKIGRINWGNCGQTVEAGLQKWPEISEIYLVLATEIFGVN
ncbi:hypothetical protein [Microcoleus sp. B13-B6]|uniref:hypothetical protein n=1 Tax=Microcoleus sp. B13-B6 TaxID=2818652 RepID=UPI002FD21C4C